MTAATDTYVMMRLNRWAIYCIWHEDLMTASPKPRHVTSWLGRLIEGRLGDPDKLPPQIERPCPVDVIEAQETDRCVLALPDRLRCVIVLEYLTTMGRDEKIAAMKPAGARMSFYRRLERAHYEILGLMNDVAVGVQLTPAAAPRKAA